MLAPSFLRVIPSQSFNTVKTVSQYQFKWHNRADPTEFCSHRKYVSFGIMMTYFVFNKQNYTYRYHECSAP